METQGGRLQLPVGWEGGDGGGSHFLSRFGSSLPSSHSGYPLHTDSLTRLPVSVRVIRSHTVAADNNSKPLGSLGDDTLHDRGEGGVSRCRRRPRQGAEESAEGAAASSAARQGGRQPPPTGPDF